MLNTGDRIAQLREQRGLSQKELAERLEVSKSTVGHWESNIRRLQDEYILKLANFFGVTTDYLLGNQKPALTKKEKNDIGLEVEKLLDGLSTQADINFYGEPLTEEGKESLKMAIQMAMELNKMKAKEKFTPKKYKN